MPSRAAATGVFPLPASYEGIEVKLRFPVSGELRLWRQGTPLPTSYPVGCTIPDHDPDIREREFQAAVPF